MNDDASTSAAASASNNLESRTGATSSNAEEGSSRHGQRHEEESEISQEEARKVKKEARRLADIKRTKFLTEVIAGLDMMIYMELSAIYYMDCSFLRYLLRGMVQFFMLTPKPEFLPDPPTSRPYIGAIMGSNSLCLLLHLYLSAPSAGEATRGYLQGSVMIDFIGQKGPTSKFHLFLLDIMVILLQVTMLAVNVEKEKMKKREARSGGGSRDSGAGSGGGADASLEDPLVAQDLDAEERGVLRSDEDDGEVQPLSGSGSDNANARRGSATDELGEREELLAERAESSSGTDINHSLSAYHAGQTSIGDFALVDTVTSQYLEYQNRPRTSTVELAANIAGRRLRIIGR